MLKIKQSAAVLALFLSQSSVEAVKSKEEMPVLILGQPHLSPMMEQYPHRRQPFELQSFNQVGERGADEAP